jgi:hypothetical protein
MTVAAAVLEVVVEVPVEAAAQMITAVKQEQTVVVLCRA